MKQVLSEKTPLLDYEQSQNLFKRVRHPVSQNTSPFAFCNGWVQVPSPEMCWHFHFLG
jgi:hypothetical protein